MTLHCVFLIYGLASVVYDCGVDASGVGVGWWLHVGLISVSVVSFFPLRSHVSSLLYHPTASLFLVIRVQSSPRFCLPLSPLLHHRCCRSVCVEGLLEATVKVVRSLPRVWDFGLGGLSGACQALPN